MQNGHMDGNGIMGGNGFLGGYGLWVVLCVALVVFLIVAIVKMVEKK